MKRLLLLVLLFAVSDARAAAKTDWKHLRSGLEYTVIPLGEGKLHAFRIDPRLYRFGIVTAREVGGELGAPVKEMAKKRGALVAINGGFFTPEYASLGLLINDGKTINPLKNTSWWSIFFVKDKTPYIVHTASFQNESQIAMAVQSGPRLLVGGSIPQLKPSLAERSAVCITPGREVILVATENVVVQPKDLADLMKKGEAENGLGCETALNLDGGSSTQMYARVGSFELDVPGMNSVANAVVVYPE